jgi:phosphoenolpyruvate---glycerone phosphotransferase subunit DhaL
VTADPSGGVRLVVEAIARTAVDNERRYGDLDSAVGDGDFGYSLARGFESVLAELDQLDPAEPGALLKRVGMLITMKVGGTSGPLWGTAFLRAAAVCGDGPAIPPEQVTAMLRAAIEGIQQRGHAELGDKTLLDALVPGVDELERSLAAGADAGTALRQAASVAAQGAADTRSMVARRGRAAYAGERSVGPIDAGAAAVAEMFEAINVAWQRQETR